MKIFKRIILTLFVLAIVAAGTWVCANRMAIFQCGNPIPYIARMVLLNDKTTYLQVDSVPTTYITKKDGYETMLKTFIEKRRLMLVSQEGNTYVYASGATRITISGEVYWRDYMVWTFSVIENITLAERLN